MKKNIILICIFIYQITLSQSQNPDHLLDPKGNKYELDLLSTNSLHTKYPEFSLGFRIVKDSGMIHQKNVPIYLKYTVNYKVIKDSIEHITSKKYNDSTIFIIDFQYADDICSSSFSNKMTKGLIKERKKFYNPLKKKMEKKSNLIFLVLFDKEIQLNNNLHNEKEYFYSDINNTFKKNLFLNPTVCGSSSIIKPDGSTLIRNGEYRPDKMAEHLNPIIWNSIFKD